MKNNLVTKPDLERALENLRKKVSGEVKNFKNKTFNRLDAVMGELKTLREEQIIHFGQHEDIEERIVNPTRFTS
jgi:hypothetical protein